MKKLFFVMVAVLAVALPSCGRQAPSPKLIKYEITSQWDMGVEVSIPHFATANQIKKLNDHLKDTYFVGSAQVHILYHCLDHLNIPELIAEYTYNAATGYERLDISSSTPGNRYPYSWTIEKIKKFEAEAKQKLGTVNEPQ